MKALLDPVIPVPASGNDEGALLLNRYRWPVIVIFLGTVVSIATFIIILSFSMKQAENDFQSEAHLHTTLMQRWLKEQESDLQLLAEAAQSHQLLEPHEFDQMSDPVLKGKPFEAVYFMEIRDGSQTKLLFQRGHTHPEIIDDRNLRVALEQVSDRGSITYRTLASNPEIGFTVYHTNRKGFYLLGTWDVKSMMNEVYTAREKELSDRRIFLLERTHRNGILVERVLYSSMQNGEFNIPIGHTGQEVTQHITRMGDFSAAVDILPDREGKNYQIVALEIGVNNYVSQVSNYTSWVILLLGMVLTGIIGVLLFQLIGKNLRIEKEVMERTTLLTESTRELTSKSDALKKAAAQAQAASATKSQFLANMSHEIRTPLNSMIGMTELVLDSGLPPQQDSHMRTVLNSAETLLEIINDILDFSKIESGKLALEPIAFDLRDTIEETVELFVARTREKERKLELLVQFGQNVGDWAVADPVRIKQVLCNLTSNAIKFTEEGYVMISVAEEADTIGLQADEALLRVSVQDTGMGIAEEKQNMIFDKFSQADTSTTRKYGGTGLGLAIVRELVSLMGGTLGVQSVVGEGSTFWFTMRVKRHVPEITGQDVAEKDSGILAGKRVLVVDDTEPSRIIIENMVRQHGMIPYGLATGEGGMAWLAGNMDKVDIIITDLILPGMDGQALLQRVRAHPVMSKTPVVIVTALGEKGYMRECAASGASGYLTKPLREKHLMPILQEIVNRQLQEQDIPMLTPHLLDKSGNTKKQVDTNYVRGARLLVVEDNRVNREFAQELLAGQFGCEVVTAANGLEAISAMEKSLFDVVLMDCQMPVMDGFEASRILSDRMKAGSIRNTPIIALTANAMKGDRDLCLAAGMNDYITKPVRKNAMLQILINWLPKEEDRVSAKSPTDPDQKLAS